jgi:hypothetical protein
MGSKEIDVKRTGDFEVCHTDSRCLLAILSPLKMSGSKL